MFFATYIGVLNSGKFVVKNKIYQALKKVFSWVIKYIK